VKSVVFFWLRLGRPVFSVPSVAHSLRPSCEEIIMDTFYLGFLCGAVTFCLAYVFAVISDAP
jgi:hypothetical protein